MAPALIKPRSVLIIGGGSGIGFEAVAYLVSKTDCKVLVSTLEVTEQCENLAATYPDRLWFHQGDVTVTSDVEEAVRLAVHQMGGIDSLVYCAGLLYVETCARVDLDRVKRVFEVNVLGAITAVCPL